MKESIETGIRLKAISIYIMVALVCCGIMIYVYNLRQDIDSQRQHMEQYHSMLALTNEFVFMVNQAQAEANFYVSSKNEVHWELFKRKAAEVERLSDLLQTKVGKDSVLNEISTLLEKKGDIVAKLNKQFNIQNPIDSISGRLQHLDTTKLKDSLLVTTIMKDTLVKTIPKKGFWKRLADVFSPGSKADSMIRVTTRKIDTIKLVPEGKQNLVSDVNALAAEASKSYSSRIAAIEQQVSQLILTDQEISLQITNLLHQLSSRIIDSTLAEIQKSAQLIRRNYTFSIIGSGVSLALILIFILLIINDVNKGKTARKALEEANKRTQQIMESRHQLLLSVSHDIKTPLGSILGYLELWRNDNAIPQKQLHSMQNSGKHILSLLDNLLEFSSLEQGTLTLTCCNFNLWDLCSETAEMFEPLARFKKLIFETDFSFDRNAEIYSDALKIKQIIINVLSNSVKYTSSGSIEFEAAYDNGKVCFCICDTGAGIPANRMGTLFKPFARVDCNNTLAPGSGLGMFVVKGLVDLLQGTIEITSTVGKGTQIEITISAKPVLEKQSITIASKNILLVDDDPALLAMLTDMIKKLGHKVDVCDNPVEFDFRAGEYDMAITDMEMGNISGTDVLGKIRSTGINIVVAIMTGRGDYNETKAVEDGFDGFLPKPVTMYALEKLIGSVAISSTTISYEVPPVTPGDFSLLEEMFDGDRQAIAEVLKVFVNTTNDNIRMLRQAVAGNDFGQAQALCHKMLPMFMQVGAPTDCTEFLKLMDAARNDTPDQHPYWRGKISDFTILAERLIEKIHKEYLLG